MGLDRRTFLQQAALALVSVGGSEAGINLLSKNSRFAGWLKPYVEALAQTTNRKLALLVGVNEYSEKARLHGCVNDVELQKELLIYRFGFKPQDIITLSDRKATRENIENAFIEHLTEQANSDDLVLFHFSGYGSQVKVSRDSDSTQYRLVNSLMPVDGIIQTKGITTANDLLQDTLLSLGRSLKTDNLITVLDTSFQTTKETLQGNYRIRSYSEVGELPSSEELAFQAQLKRNFTAKGIGAYLQNSSIPGTILVAAEQNKIALEGTWNNFSAGLLTYALTRYLWQTTAPTNIQIALQQTANSASSWSEKQQKPQVTGKVNVNLASNASQNQLSGGEGFIRGFDSKGMANLKLTALPFALLDAYQEESCFEIPNYPNSTEKTLLQLRSLEGIAGKGQILDTATAIDRDTLKGKPIQETIRVLPRNLELSVALDSHLQRIERVDATSALANVTTVKAAASAGEAYADCLLGKISLMMDKKSEGDPHGTENPSHSYGLYNPKGKLIPNTPGEANEVVKLAVSRLEPYFSRLLAAKLLEVSVNDYSSTIPVSANLDLVNRKSTLITNTALRVATNPEFERNIPSLENNSEIQFKIDNQSDRELYFIMIGVDSNDKFITLYNPQQTKANNNNLPDSLKISAKTQLTIPQPNNVEKWKVKQDLGIAKVYLIMAVKPFTNTLSLIAQQLTTKLDEQQLINLSSPLEVSEAILQDLHHSSDVSSDILASNSDVYALDVNKWASFQFIYDVV